MGMTDKMDKNDDQVRELEAEKVIEKIKQELPSVWLGGRQKLVLVKVIVDALKEKDEQALCRAQNPLEHADYFTPIIEARVRAARREQTSKDYTHWLTVDPSSRNMGKIQQTLDAGSGFTVQRVYTHPSKGHLAVLEIRSDVPYQDLDLDVDSLSSPIKRLPNKPRGLTKGLDLVKWENIYGQLVADRTKIDPNQRSLAPPRRKRRAGSNDPSHARKPGSCPQTYRS